MCPGLSDDREMTAGIPGPSRLLQYVCERLCQNCQTTEWTVNGPKNWSRELVPNWHLTCPDAFETLKKAWISAPVLAHADLKPALNSVYKCRCLWPRSYNEPNSEGEERVIAFASRTLRPREKNYKNYSSFKLEFLALTWVVTKKFSECLYCAPFVVHTDNNSLVLSQICQLGAKMCISPCQFSAWNKV